MRIFALVILIMKAEMKQVLKAQKVSFPGFKTVLRAHHVLHSDFMPC